MRKSRTAVHRSARKVTLAEQFQRRWLAGSEPLLDDFAASAEGASAGDICGVLRVDLRERWRRGTRLLSEQYLARFPQVANDCEAAVDLVFTEFLLREDLGERPSEAEYVARFPRYAQLLATQIAIHQAIIGAQLTSPNGSSAATNISNSGEHLEPMPGAPGGAAEPPRFGRYQTVRLLGRGGMGSVWLARDVVLDRDVALKLPRFTHTCGAEVIDRFYREARAAAKLSHQNLCTIYDVGDDNGVPYLAMQYLSGETLDTMLRRDGAMAPQRAIDIARQIAMGLEIVHQAGVVHRDLKPGNVIFNDRGVPIVTDFGLALLHTVGHAVVCDVGTARFDAGSELPLSEVGTNPRLTVTGQLLGTPAYAAPEQLSGLVKSLSPGVDVYSLGVVLFEMLTGKVPFTGTVPEVTRRVQSELPPLASDTYRGVPLLLDPICLRSMAKDPLARFGSMAEFRRALEQVLSLLENESVIVGEAPVHDIVSPIRGHLRGPALNRRHLLGAGGLTVLAAATAFYGLRSTSETLSGKNLASGSIESIVGSTASAPTAKIAFDDNAPRLKIFRQHSWPDRHAFMTRFSPNGAYYSAGGEYFRNEQVRIWSTETGDEVLKVRGSYVRFSPDCKTVYSAVNNNSSEIEYWDVASGARLAPFQPREWPCDLAASANGKKLVSTHSGYLAIWSVATRKLIVERPLKDCTSPNLSLVNHGNAVLAYDNRESGSVHLLDLIDDRVTRRFIDPDPCNARLLRGANDGPEFTIFNRRSITTWIIDRPTPIRNFILGDGSNETPAQAISRDLKWGLCTNERSGLLYLINLETGKTHGVAPVGGRDVLLGQHDFSPDGRYAVICRTAPSDVYIFEMPPEVRNDMVEL